MNLSLHELTRPSLKPPSKNNNILKSFELVGQGQLNEPEDIAYNAESGVIYTGCADGWIKQVTVNESVGDITVLSWVNTGGRPLGLALYLVNRDLILADAFKGLLRVSGRDGGIELLTDEAEGVKFKLTDAVAIDAEDGSLYFTDASYEYTVADSAVDILGGKPHGRLLRYDPVTKQTTVMLRDLYFANGIEISPDQQSLVFCETPMCRKYYIKGEKKGNVEKFSDNLPGLPDNIHYDGHGHYWIAFPAGITAELEFSLKQPLRRKAIVMFEKYIKPLHMEKNSGVSMVDLDGKPVAHYNDAELSFITTGYKIGNHLYLGNLIHGHIFRLDLAKHPAQPTAL